MSSSGMLRRVDLARTDVSEELSVSIISVTRIGELGTEVAYLVTMMMKALISSDTSSSYESHRARHPRRRHSSEYRLVAPESRHGRYGEHKRSRDQPRMEPQLLYRPRRNRTLYRLVPDVSLSTVVTRVRTHCITQAQQSL
jgi:hypothetical protein